MTQNAENEFDHPIAAYRAAHGRMSQEDFGKLFDPPVSKVTVHRWENAPISAERAIQIESVTSIPREDLRPDLFIRPKEKVA